MRTEMEKDESKWFSVDMSDELKSLELVVDVGAFFV